ncbi:MAG TPA: PIN domain-containing protein [Candidatus Acidoferrales bacterium]|nr:PIN domain-containing protein [Candidatus Acidoferrales bacterium]
MTPDNSAAVLFLDANVFLHFAPMEDVDWPRLAKVELIRLMICQATIRDLDKVKAFGQSKKIRHRAGSALTRLGTLLNRPAPVYVRQNVELSFRSDDPLIDFAAHRLSKDQSDDWLLATILEFRSESPENRIALVTNDVGLKLKASSGHAVQCIELPEQYKLPEEPDPEQKRIQELEQELSVWKRQAPNLKLAFSNGADHIRFRLAKPPLLSDADLARKMNDVRAPYPKMAKPQAYSIATLSMGMVGPQEAERYNERLDRFYSAYERYFRETDAATDTKSRLFQFELVLSNVGSRPAEDIDVCLILPDGLRVSDDADSLCRFPEEPKPPAGPRGAVEEMMASLTSSPIPSRILSPDIAEKLDAIHRLHLVPRNVSGPKIHETNSFDVAYHVRELKHTRQVEFDPLFVLFDSWDTAKSFSLGYEILAGNVPQPLTDRLHVVIDLTPISP